MSAAQDQHFRQLCDVHDAVAARPFPDGTLALTARDKAGRIAGAELVDPAGATLALDETIRRLGAARQAALELAEAATDHLIATLALAAVENPDAVNLSDVNRETGVARQTLYNRLKDLELSKSLPKPSAAPAAAAGKSKAA